MASLRSRRTLRPVGFDELGLRRAISDRMLPFLVAAMAFLAALALAGWVGAASLARHWQQGAGSEVTVQVPRPGEPSAQGGGDAGRSGAGPAGGRSRHCLGARAQRRGAGRAAAALAGQWRRTTCRAVARGDRGTAGRCRPGTRPDWRAGWTRRRRARWSRAMVSGSGACPCSRAACRRARDWPCCWWRRWPPR